MLQLISRTDSIPLFHGHICAHYYTEWTKWAPKIMRQNENWKTIQTNVGFEPWITPPQLLPWRMHLHYTNTHTHTHTHTHKHTQTQIPGYHSLHRWGSLGSGWEVCQVVSLCNQVVLSTYGSTSAGWWQLCASLHQFLCQRNEGAFLCYSHDMLQIHRHTEIHKYCTTHSKINSLLPK